AWPGESPARLTTRAPQPPSVSAVPYRRLHSDRLPKGEHMFKKVILGVAIALVLAVAGVTVAAASSAGATKHRVQTINLVAKQTQSTLLVLAASGHGPVGNQFLTT